VQRLLDETLNEPIVTLFSMPTTPAKVTLPEAVAGEDIESGPTDDCVPFEVALARFEEPVPAPIGVPLNKNATRSSKARKQARAFLSTKTCLHTRQIIVAEIMTMCISV
jgi:hypothetical protein